MDKLIRLHKNVLIIGIPLLIIGMMILITKSSVFEEYPKSLSTAITFDLLLTVPFIYYLLIRKTRVPKITVVPLLVIGMIVCALIIPPQNQYYLELFKTWVFPVIEIAIVWYIIYNVSKALKQYRLVKKESADFFTTLKDTCADLLPKIAIIPFVTEIAVFYYGFIYWKKRRLNDNEFSYHKESGTVSLLIAIMLIITIETVVLHILLAKWSIVAAWILTCLSTYSIIQLFGFLKSMYKRPILIEKGKLFLRYGIMNETIIDLKNIKSIAVSSTDIELNKETRKLSFLGELESHNVIIKLHQESILFGLYGIKRQYKNLALHVDKKNEFVNRLKMDL
ncbi:hypothetical protein [Hanstruepera flava]|uniref:hypothetical protein n=1 Tax=Hanstruepera flava TaxID=2930218 RepID=UPI0020298959|nr:hypothetical protein [Hanstruepera flava]